MPTILYPALSCISLITEPRRLKGLGGCARPDIQNEDRAVGLPPKCCEKGFMGLDPVGEGERLGFEERSEVGLWEGI